MLGEVREVLEKVWESVGRGMESVLGCEGRCGKV